MAAAPPPADANNTGNAKPSTASGLPSVSPVIAVTPDEAAREGSRGPSASTSMMDMDGEQGVREASRGKEAVDMGEEGTATSGTMTGATKRDDGNPATPPPMVHPYSFSPFEGSRASHSQPPASSTTSTSALVGKRIPSVLDHLSRHLVVTYEKCRPGQRFKYTVPRRVLTQPKKPVMNEGLDNAEANLICSVGDKLESNHGHGVYEIIDLLGQGTFGQVFKCQEQGSRRMLAIKVVKSKPAYFRQAQSEVAVLTLLNERTDAKGTSGTNGQNANIVRLLDHFIFKAHLCLVFELLDLNLYELLKQNQFRGLPLPMIRHFLSQILEALIIIEDAHVIHCDLKPENILLAGQPPSNAPPSSTSASSSGTNNPRSRSPQNMIKVIDFGSACFEGNTMYTYIQSRFYRSPEILLGLPYDCAIDMWSLGCICGEMFLGLPIFPGVSEHNQLTRIIEMLGPPPDFMLDYGTNTLKYFKKRSILAQRTASQSLLRSPREAESGGLSTILSMDVIGLPDDEDAGPLMPVPEAMEGRGKQTKTSPVGPMSSQSRSFVLKTAEEYAADTKTAVVNSKKYFKHRRLQDIVMSYPHSRKLSKEEIDKEMDERKVFLHFIFGLLELNTWKRWTARQAADHPFITGEGFDESVGFDPPEAVVVRDRRLQSMNQQHQRLLQKYKDRMAAGDSDSQSRCESLAQGLSYIQAAAVALGRPVLGDNAIVESSYGGTAVETSAKDAAGAAPTSQDVKPPPGRSAVRNSSAYNSFQGPSSAGARLGSDVAMDGMAWSAPHGFRVVPGGGGRGGLRRATVGAQAILAHQAAEGGGGSGVTLPVRSTRHFMATGNAESYTYDSASEMMGTDFGFALQRPGMVHFSPQQQSFAGYMGHHPSSYGDPYMVQQMVGGRSHLVNGTSPHTPGNVMMGGRSWGHQYNSGGGGGGNFAMRSPANLPHQYMGMPPPPPPQSSWAYGAIAQGGMVDDDSGYDRRSTPTSNSQSVARKLATGEAFAQFSSPPLEAPHPPTGMLENALADWDPFWADFEEELGGSAGSGSGGGGGPTQPSDYYSPSHGHGGGHGKHPRSGGGGSGGKGKDFYANSPKQHNGMHPRGGGQHQPQPQQLNTPPRFYRGGGGLGASGSGGGRGGSGGTFLRHRNAYSSSPGHGGSFNARTSRSGSLQGGGPQPWAEGPPPPPPQSGGFDSSSAPGKGGGYPQPHPGYGGGGPLPPPPSKGGEFDGPPPYGGGGPYWQPGGSGGGGGRRRPSGDGIKGVRRGGHGSSGLQMEVQPGSYGTSPALGKFSGGAVPQYGSAPKDGSLGRGGGPRGHHPFQQHQPHHPQSQSLGGAFPPQPPPGGGEAPSRRFNYSP